jgi:hypothetical protein
MISMALECGKYPRFLLLIICAGPGSQVQFAKRIYQKEIWRFVQKMCLLNMRADLCNFLIHKF